MPGKLRKRLFWSSAVVMAALHVDFFNHGRMDPLLFGWIPRDMAYHILWVVIAAVMVFYFTHTIWRTPK